MLKIRERQTATNLVFYYKFDQLRSSEDLDSWFEGFIASAENLVQFKRVSLDDTCGSKWDGWPVDMNVQECRKSVRQAMRDAGANHLTVFFIYQDAHMVLGLTLGDWEVALVASRKDADKLREFADILALDRS